MDFLKKAISSVKPQSSAPQNPGQHKDDPLDKAVDVVQQRVLKHGSQKNESAAEQAKDEKISDTIRSLYKKATGKEFPIKDKS